MKKVAKNKKITIDDLAIMVAKGFEDVKSELRSEINGVKIELKSEINELKSEVGELRGEIKEVKENLRITRNDVLNIGDKFVSYHTFDQLASRVSTLEKKAKIK